MPVFRWALERWGLASWAETLAEEWGAAHDGAVPKEEGGPAFALEGKHRQGKMVLETFFLFPAYHF